MIELESTSLEQQELPAIEPLLQMLLGRWVSQVVVVVAQLGIADILQNGARSLGEIAELTGTNVTSLYRLLRASASLGIFLEKESQYFELTPLSKYLLSDSHASIRELALMFGQKWHQDSWTNLLYSIKTSESAFVDCYGMPPFKYFANNPEIGKKYNESMTSISTMHSKAIAQAYDFSAFTQIVDVAGGQGMLLANILQANPCLQGILFDQPTVIDNAIEAKVLERAGVLDRCKMETGDFFKSIPSGADAYIFKHIIHDWDDEHVLKILQNCYQAMPKHGILLIADYVIPNDNTFHFGKLMDLEMLVTLPGARERTADEFTRMFTHVGFQLQKIIPTLFSMSIIEAVKI